MHKYVLSIYKPFLIIINFFLNIIVKMVLGNSYIYKDALSTDEISMFFCFSIIQLL